MMSDVWAEKLEGVENTPFDPFKAVDRLIELDLNSDDLLTHDVLISVVLQIEDPYAAPNPKEFQKRMLQKATFWSETQKVALREHNMCFRSAIGEGYVVVPPEEQAKFAEDAARKKARKELLRAKDRITYTDTSGMSEADRQARTDALVRVARLQDAFNRKRKDGWHEE